MHYQVFISSKSEDYPIAEKVYAFLKEQGVSAFIASKELEKIGDAQYADAIDEALDSSDNLIVVASSLENIKSKWVHYEWMTFSNDLKSGYRQGNLITIRTSNIAIKNLPPSLRHQQSFLDNEYQQSILGYIKDIETDDTSSCIEPESLELTPSIDCRDETKEKEDYLIIDDETVYSEGLEYEFIKSSIDNTFTAIVKGAGSFKDKELFIPPFVEHNGVKHTVTCIGKSAFADCKKLSSVVLPPTITSIEEYAFYECSLLEIILISNGVTKIGTCAFSACKKLSSITIPQSVTEMKMNAFNDCEALKEINVSEDNPNYCSEKGVLYNKDKTIFLKCPGGKIGVCKVPNGIISIGGSAFNFCKKISSVLIPESVTNIFEMAFYLCTGLKTISIPHSVTEIGSNAFLYCSALEEIVVDPNNNSYSSDKGILYNKDKTILKKCPGGKSGEYDIPKSVREIEAYAFQGCEQLTSITMHEHVINIGEYAFEWCSGLTSIIIPSSVKRIGDCAFDSCKKLQSVILTNGVTHIGSHAFALCDDITSIEIPESVIEIDSCPFLRSPKLQTINVSRNNPYFCSVNGVLFNKSKTALIQYPCGKQGKYEIPNGVLQIEDSAFNGCYGLNSVTVPSSVRCIKSCAFYLTSLSYVRIPKNTQLEHDAFHESCIVHRKWF